MNFYRNVILVLENEERKCELLKKIPNWEYCDNLEPTIRESDYSFKLVNKSEDISIYFRKVKDCIYRSVNVLPYKTGGLNKICEPQEKDIHNDILFKLCMNVKRKYVNFEVLCGIIPCEGDEI